MTATKTEPTDEQLQAYADRLPGIYREVMASFPNSSPNRRVGDGLYLSSIDGRLQEIMPADYRTHDLTRAVAQLEARRFLSRDAGSPSTPRFGVFPDYSAIVAQALRDDGDPFLAPTALGERLITALTGHTPAERDIPPLPEPTWG